MVCKLYLYLHFDISDNQLVLWFPQYSFKEIYQYLFAPEAELVLNTGESAKITSVFIFQV